jgi:hypothetical protein
MTPSQKKAIEYFRRFMENKCKEKCAGHDRVIKTWEVNDNGSFVSVNAVTDIPSLSEGSLLRYVDQQYWLVFIGKGGSITAKMYPDSYKQFKGRRKLAFGMNFK